MSNGKLIGCILHIFIYILWLLFPIEAFAISEDKSPILIICSYNPAAQQTSVTISDYMEEYDRLGGKRDIIIENMNCKSFSESTLWGGVLYQILAKYQGERQPAQIILLGQEAWAAYLSQRSSIRIKVPVMCSMVSSNVVALPTDTTRALKDWMPMSIDGFTDSLDIPELRYGFINHYNIDGNIDMIKSFYPKTQHIALITDNTYGGVTMQALVRKSMEKYFDLDLILLDGRCHTIYTIVEELRKLPENTVVMVGTWRVDMNEGYFMRNATYTMMEAIPEVPVFTPSSVSLGYWAIGGVIPNYQKFGKDMAVASLEIDTHPEDTLQHFTMVDSKAVLDSRKIEEWKLSLTDYPFDVEMINQPVSFYEQYTYHIWIACFIFLTLTLGLLISLFFYFRTKRLKDKLLQSENELRVAKDRAEESNRLKSAFLANMSHEIRTPLNSIVGFSDVLIVNDSTEEERNSYCQIIKSNSDLLLRLINDVLEISRLEANRVTLIWETCDAVLLCRQVIASVRVSSCSGNQFLFVSEYQEFRLETDMQRLQQVIINLLSNAAKFTENGKITLEFSVNKKMKMAVFSVTDTGCGIPKEKQALVFERFEKLDEYAQGTGLGLPICKLIINKWKGDIWIDSDYTDGARFMFSHPLNTVKE